MHWYTDVLKKYTLFEGRAGRQEFWMFVLFSVIISVVLSIIDMILGLTSVLSGLYALAVLLPSIAVGIRRLHDTGRPGVMLLLVLIPFVGAIILIVFYAQDSAPGANAYGANPKGL